MEVDKEVRGCNANEDAIMVSGAESTGEEACEDPCEVMGDCPSAHETDVVGDNESTRSPRTMSSWVYNRGDSGTQEGDDEAGLH